MIQHIVLLALSSDHEAAELEAIMQELAMLVDRLPGFTKFEHGPNRDFESLSQNYDYGFVCHFADEKTSHAYLDDATHKALGKRLLMLCDGGVEGIMVIDLEVGR